MAGKDYGSLTKEPPLATLDATIRAITPSMPYNSLLAYARANTHRDAPGLISKRFLLVSSNDIISYDHFLSLVATHQLASPFIRKIMYFLWAYRDDRIRRFVCERIADKSGRWRIPQLLNKGNSSFFERWLQPSTARKARSNFEFFLVETGIYDAKSRALHLELDDGWLEQAAIAAAQHERDPFKREGLLANPVVFLEDQGWLGLLNAARNHLPIISPILATDSVPLEDETIRTRPLTSPTGSDWARRSPSTSGRRSATANIDLVARERASQSHYMLEKLLVAAAKAQSLAPKFNQNVDIYFETASGTVLAEVKSCTDNNFHSQLRKGISQLFEYRFLYQAVLGTEVTMLLLMEAIPPHDKSWLVDYVLSLGIILAWKDSRTQTIVSTHSLPPSLSGIVASAPP
jgi:hypothetical protein